MLPDALELVPEYFGVLGYYPESKYMIEKREPKTLFNYKWSDEEMANIMRLGTMRIYSLKMKLREYEQQ